MSRLNKILSIDDSLTMRSMLKKTVEEMGYEFLEASDGSNGLEVLAKERDSICLILLDWNMPGMNGLEFLKAVKTNVHFQVVPIIMVTTEAEKENVIKALQHGVKNYILKPFTNEELTLKITKSARRI